MSAVYQGLHSRTKWRFLQNPKTTTPPLCAKMQVIFFFCSILKNGGEWRGRRVSPCLQLKKGDLKMAIKKFSP